MFQCTYIGIKQLYFVLNWTLYMEWASNSEGNITYSEVSFTRYHVHWNVVCGVYIVFQKTCH